MCISSGQYAMVLTNQRSEFLVILDYGLFERFVAARMIATATLFPRAAEHLGC